MSTFSNAAARRWLDLHVGCTIETIQTSPRHTWMPLDRMLSRRSTMSWTLDGSTVVVTSEHTVENLTDDSLTLAWRAEDGTVIHTTTYTVVKHSAYGIAAPAPVIAEVR